MNDLRDQFPDTYELADQSFIKIDKLLEDIDHWKDDHFSDQFDRFRQLFGESEQIALIVRSLEKNGMPIGLPDHEILMAMFSLIEDTFVLSLHMVANEDIRI